MKTSKTPFFIVAIAVGAGTASLGLVLMAISLHYNVNPICAGAMRGGIQNHMILAEVLGITTVPAMCLALFLDGIFSDRPPDWTPIFIPTVFLCQFILSFALGTIFSVVIRLLCRNARR